MIRYCNVLILLTFLMYGCEDKDLVTNSDVSIADAAELHLLISNAGDTIPTGVPIPVAGNQMSASSTSGPEWTPVRGQPKVTPLQSNVFAGDQPKVTPIPAELPVFIPGQDGIPLPDTVVARGNKVRASRPQPVAAGAPHIKDAASHDLQILNVEQGMISPHVRCMIEDRRGNLWFGTENGLSRYDGRSFAHYTTKQGLSDNRIRSILEDKQGNLWIGTHNGGVNRFDGEHFIQYSTQSGLSHNTVWAIMEDRRGDIWVGTSHGLNRYAYDARTGAGYFIRYYLEAAWDYIRAILQDKQGNIWLGTYRGLIHFEPEKNGKRGSFTSYPAEHIATGFSARAIAEDSDGNLWMGTPSGLTQLVHKESVAIHYPIPYGKPTPLNRGQIFSIIIDSEGRIWAATITNGLTCFTPDHGGGVFEHFTTDEGLSDNFIWSVMEDSRGNIWCGTLNGGVNRYNSRSFKHFMMQHGLVENHITAIQEDHRGDLWIGTYGGGVSRFDGQVFTHFTDNEGLADNAVRCIMEDQQGNLWFGTDSGISGFDGNRFLNYRSGTAIWSISEDERGLLWFGTYIGVISLDRKGHQFTQYSIEQGLPHTTVWSTLHDNNGNLWFGTYGGLTKYQAENRKGMFTHYSTAEGLADNTVRSILEDRAGGLWIGTDGGLNRYQPGATSSPDFASLFTNDQVFSILEDKSANIWFSTPSNIVLLKSAVSANVAPAGAGKVDIPAITFGRGDGLKTLGSTTNGACLDSDNRLWWGSNNGLAMLDLNRYEEPTEPPSNLQLTHIELHRQFVDYSRLSDTAYRHQFAFGAELASSFDSVSAFYNYPVKMSLPHDLNHLTFHFSAIDWAAPHKIRYRYYLEGLDKEWSALRSEHSVNYQNLRHGTYTLHTKAISAAQLESDTFTYTFTILPPWWLSWWAKVLYALTVFGVLYYIRYLELKKQHRKLALEQEKLAQERDLNEQLRRVDKLKDQFLANTSHELRTPLQGIIGLSESLLEEENKQDKRENLHMIISSGKRLANLVNDILDFSKLKNYDIQLQRRPVNLRVLTDIVLRNNLPLIRGKDLELINEIPADLPPVAGDENRLQQILYNLVGNAVKFTESGYVKIGARQDVGMIQLSVEDTGTGIPEDKRDAIFQEFEQADGSISREFAGTGLGLSISKRLVELHGGRMWVTSAVGKGSTFYCTLPVSTGKGAGISLAKEEQGAVQRSVSDNTATVMAPMLSDNDDAFGILVVDDEPINQQVLKNHLSGSNFKLSQAMNGEEAIRLIESGEDIDLVLLDVMMPRMSGYEVCEKIRVTYLPSELPVIMITAKNQLQDIVHGLSVGANDYLAKPFHKEELLARINTQLDLHRIFEVAGRFVPNDFLHSLNRDRLTEVRLGDHIEQEVTVLFTDIRDYTSLAEMMSPEENFGFVNAFHSRMGPVIRRHDGFVNQYLGDAIMAIFPKGPENALQAAIDMQEQLRQYNEERLARGRQSIRMGVGMHTGSLIMGIIGDQQRMDAATIADTVNTASRIESLTKHYGVSILLSEDSLEQIDDHSAFHFRYLGQVQVKGRKEPIGLWECSDGDVPEVATKKESSREAFEKGLQQFFKQEFPQAVATFNDILQKNPDDLPARLFMTKASKYLLNGVPEDWTGVEVMDVK